PDHTDDGRPRFICVAHIGTHAHALSDGVAIVELAFGQGLAYQDGDRGSGSVFFIEQPPSAKRNSHRLEVIGTDGITKGSLVVMWVGFKFNSINFIVAAQRQLTDECCRSNTGKMTNLFQSL